MATADLTEIRERLARIETTQNHQDDVLKRIDGKLDGIDGRLRGVERTSAAFGSLAGGIVSVGVALITARFKSGA